VRAFETLQKAMKSAAHEQGLNRSPRVSMRSACCKCLGFGTRALAPLSLRAASLLRRNLVIYGVGGIVVPFIGIKIVDVLITAIGWA
jgi:hypothetical protein